jgi:ribosomal protein S18 acetylase RimI-like enzyme
MVPILHSPLDVAAYFAGHVLLHEQVFVAELNQIIVGFIVLEGGHIDHLYVAPSYQLRGIGHQLLDMAKTLHSDGLRLWTLQHNARARQF